MLIISTIEELEKLKSFQEFSFYCVQCGKLHTMRLYQSEEFQDPIGIGKTPFGL